MLKAKLHTSSEPWQSVAVDLFELADYAGQVESFLNIVDMFTGFQLVGLVVSKHPAHVFEEFLKGWCGHYGPPARALVDGGGEFVAEFSHELEDLGCEIKYTAGLAPTQNATCERRGGNWKLVARAVIDEHSIRFSDRRRLHWLICSVNWAVNSQVNDSGYSPAQWALGRGIRLPYNMLSAGGRMSFLDRISDEPSFADRLAMMASAQRAALGLRSSQALARAWHSRARGDSAHPAAHQYAVGDVVYYWRGRGKRKCDWSLRWLGPARVIGFEHNNVWVSHRNRTIKAAAVHLRPATGSEKMLAPDAFTRLLEGDSLQPLDAVPPQEENASPEEEQDPKFFDMTVDQTQLSHKRRRTTPTAPAPDAPTWGPTALDSTSAGPASAGYGPVRSGNDLDSSTGGGDSRAQPRGRPASRAPRSPRSASPRVGPYENERSPRSRRAETAEAGIAFQTPQQQPQPRSQSEAAPRVARFGNSSPSQPAPSHEASRPSPADLRRNLSFLEALVDDLGDPGFQQPEGGIDQDGEVGGVPEFNIATPRESRAPDDGPLENDDHHDEHVDVDQQNLALSLPQEPEPLHDAPLLGGDASTVEHPSHGAPPGLLPPARQDYRASDRESFPRVALAAPTTPAPARPLPPARRDYRARDLDDVPLALVPMSDREPTPPRFVSEKASPHTAQLEHDGSSPSKRHQPSRETCLVSGPNGYGLAPYKQWLDVMLVGRARSKEVAWSKLDEQGKAQFKVAMAEEWSRWEDFKAFLPMTAKEYTSVMARAKPPEMIGTRWVLTWKTMLDGSKMAKARLVAQGCQELNRSYRTDSPTASRTGFFLTLMAAVQDVWRLESYDAKTAFLQSGEMSRDLMFRLPKGDQAPPGCETEEYQIVWANGAVYGTRDAGRKWYLYLRRLLIEHGWIESVLEKGLYFFREGSRTLAVLHTHVDDFLMARVDCSSKKLDDAMSSLMKRLYLKRCDAIKFTHCGKQIEVTKEGIYVSQAKAATDIDDMHIAPGVGGRRSVESALTSTELTGYYSVLGQLMWLGTQTRPDLVCDINLCAQRRSGTTVADAKKLNKLAGRARDTAERGIMLRRGAVDLTHCVVLNFSDASFANCEGEKSMCGFVVCVGAAGSTDTVWRGHYDRQAVISWASATIKRVVRSTLGAEAYACSEGTEEAQWCRAILAELFMSNGDGAKAKWKIPQGSKKLEPLAETELPRDARRQFSQYDPKLATALIEERASQIPLVSYTDASNLSATVERDSGQSRDKRLRIVVSGLRQLFAKDSIENAFLRWIPTTHMLGDCLTKEHSAAMEKPEAALVALMTAVAHKMPVSTKTALSRSIHLIGRRRFGRSSRQLGFRAALLSSIVALSGGTEVAIVSQEIEVQSYAIGSTLDALPQLNIVNVAIAMLFTLLLKWALARVDNLIDTSISRVLSAVFMWLALMLNALSGAASSVSCWLAPCDTPVIMSSLSLSQVSDPQTPPRAGSRQGRRWSPGTPPEQWTRARGRASSEPPSPPQAPAAASASARPWEMDSPGRVRREPRTRTIAVQAQCTYTEVRDNSRHKVAQPRFQPLSEAEQGAFEP